MSNLDARAVQVARDQYGLATRAQLAAAGVDHRAIRRRVAEGCWQPRERDVIDLGLHGPSPRRELMAVVLAAGPGAVVSHRSAAAVHGFLDATSPPRPDVTVPRGAHAHVGKVNLHTARGLLDDERTVLDALPVTTPARTLLDVAPWVAEPTLERWVWEQARRDPQLVHDLAQQLLRRPGARGSRPVRRILAGLHPRVDRAGSPLEVLGLIGLRDAGAPQPKLQHEVRDAAGRFVARVDAAWPSAWVIVEFDGRAYHAPTSARTHDEARVSTLRALGWHVIVLRAEDLTPSRLRQVADEIRGRGATATG
ncbi:MAG: type IV toxin-antitoxin system AbiEi family antitoxin domain-containing protein [Actinomycetota bacterium]